MTMNSLPDELKLKIEANRKKALELRKAKEKQTNFSEAVQRATKFCNVSDKSELDKGNKALFPADQHKILTGTSEFYPAEKTNKNHNVRGGVLSGSNQMVQGTFVLISKERFVVNVKYQPQVIEIFKTIPSKMYDSKSRSWSFDVKDHDKLVSLLTPLKPLVTFGPLPAFVRKALNEVSTTGQSCSPDLSALPSSILDALMPFQNEGVCFGISRGGRVLIADDMGLGKTIQALAIAAFYRADWPLLIATPSSVRYTWAEAIERWLGLIVDREIVIVESSKDALSNGLVVILTYDLLARRAKEVQSLDFGVVIMDESHMLKSFKTARYKAAAPVIKKAKRALLLSGTPALSRPSELYTQVSAVEPKLFPNFQDFGIRYCAGKQLPWGWDFTGSSNLEELQIILENRIMIRRMKSDVISQLPAKTRMTVTLDQKSISLSRQTFQEAARHFGLKSLSGSEKHSAMLEFFAESSHCKLKAVGEYIKELLEQEKKFLVFAHHKVMIDNLCRTCDEAQTRYVRIDGSTSSEDRQALVELFQVKDDIRVAVLSIVAASTGVTLTAANLVVFAELFWNPGVLVQAEDRTHRIGQQDNVLIQYLIAKGTIDDHMWPMIQTKLDVLGKAGLARDNFSNADNTVQKESGEDFILQYFPVREAREAQKPAKAGTLENYFPAAHPPPDCDMDDISCFLEADDLQMADLSPPPEKKPKV